MESQGCCGRFGARGILWARNFLSWGILFSLWVRAGWNGGMKGVVSENLGGMACCIYKALRLGPVFLSMAPICDPASVHCRALIMPAAIV